MSSRRAAGSVLLALFTVAILAAGGCWRPAGPAGPAGRGGSTGPGEPDLLPRAEPADDSWAPQRRRMVDEQLRSRDVRNERVLTAMERVPRHDFVPERLRGSAYQDQALPIEHGQTISQPFMVAYMTQTIDPRPEHRVLEVGTGSGYQAAILAELVRDVYTIELIPELARQAEARLKQRGYRNVHVRAGDGYLGWPEAAPFDSIMVTCGAEHVPEPLFEQLKPGGTMVIPVGSPPENLSLQLITKGPDGERRTHDLMPVRFVPLRRSAPGAK